MIYKYNTFIYLAWYVYSSWAIVRPKLILGLFRVDFGLTWCWSKVYFKFCADVWVCIYICIYIYICMYMYIYICIYACVRMDVYIYKHSIQNRTNNIINIYIYIIHLHVHIYAYIAHSCWRRRNLAASTACLTSIRGFHKDQVWMRDGDPIPGSHGSHRDDLMLGGGVTLIKLGNGNGEIADVLMMFHVFPWKYQF